MTYQPQDPIRVHPIAVAVAEALSRLNGHTWTAWTIGPTPECPDGYVQLARADGPEVSLTADRYGPKRRLHAGGKFPRSDRGEYYVPRDRASISMDSGKAPELIARDIARRLLPAYLPEWEQAVARKAASDAYWEQTASLACRLAEVCGARPPREDRGESTVSTVYLDGGHRISVSGDAATVELRGLSGDLAERILRLVVEALPPAPAPERILRLVVETREEVPGR